MDTTVEVSIPIATDVAAELDNVHKREAIGRMVSRMLRPKKDTDPLLAAMDRFSTEAKRRGITQKYWTKNWQPIMPSGGTNVIRRFDNLRCFDTDWRRCFFG